MTRPTRAERRRQRLEEQAGGPRPSKGGARRFGRRALAVGAALVVALVALGVALALLLTRGDGSGDGRSAVIVDQLSVREPNPAFVGSATALLNEAGYSVDYVPGEQATVDLYRRLPSHGYDIIVLRAHSAVPEKDLALTGDVDPDIVRRIMDRIGDDVLLFTSEAYDENAYAEEQAALRLFPVLYAGDPASDVYFAVSSGFVASTMTGRFDGATVILMGCSSLASGRTAAAFVEKGASGVAGWSDTVSPEHTDAATERLLRYLLQEGKPLQDAVRATMNELGADPYYDSILLSYP